MDGVAAGESCLLLLLRIVLSLWTGRDMFRNSGMLEHALIERHEHLDKYTRLVQLYGFSCNLSQSLGITLFLHSLTETI